MLMREMSAKTSLKILMQLFEKYEKSLNLKQFRINTIENDFYRYRLSDPNPIKLGSLLKELKSFEDQDETKPESLSAHFFIDDKTPTFVGLRKLQTALSKAKLKTEIEMKLVRSLQIDLEV